MGKTVRRVTSDDLLEAYYKSMGEPESIEPKQRCSFIVVVSNMWHSMIYKLLKR